MPIVRNIAEGTGYQPAPGERLLQLVNTGEVPLYLGIRNGDYMIAAPSGEPQVTYVLVEEQWVRLQQQLKLQITYKNWIASGLLTLTEVAELPEPTPPEEEPEAEELPTTPVPTPDPEPAPAPEPAPEAPPVTPEAPPEVEPPSAPESEPVPEAELGAEPTPAPLDPVPESEPAEEEPPP